MAERVGFEPTIPLLTGYRFSRAGPSAARQPLQYPRNCLKTDKMAAKWLKSYQIFSRYTCVLFFKQVLEIKSIIRTSRSQYNFYFQLSIEACFHLSLLIEKMINVCWGRENKSVHFLVTFWLSMGKHVF